MSQKLATRRELRTVHLRVVVSPSEAERIRRAADATGRSVSELLRGTALAIAEALEADDG